MQISKVLATVSFALTCLGIVITLSIAQTPTGPVTTSPAAQQPSAGGQAATVNSPWQSFWETLPSLLWVALAIAATLYFNKELKRLLSSLVLRLNSGSAVKFGPLEFAALTSIPAAIPKGVGVSPYWDKQNLKRDDGSLRELWNHYPAYSNYAMIVHKYFPSSEPGQLYDVLLYLVERQGGALLGVSKVEYFFGPSWNDYIYPSTDRSRGFPIKVTAYDRFICIARLHFVHTKETAIVFRYVDFEMGAYATIPTEPTKLAGTKDLPCGGQPIEIVVNEKSTP